MVRTPTGAWDVRRPAPRPSSLLSRNYHPPRRRQRIRFAIGRTDHGKARTCSWVDDRRHQAAQDPRPGAAHDRRGGTRPGARDAGAVDDRRILPATWARDSLQNYSPHGWDGLGFFHDVACGYQWWSADVGEHHVNFAWGHGGQLIVLPHDLAMLVVLTSDPFDSGPRHDQESWHSEIVNLTLVSEFIRSLPAE